MVCSRLFLFFLPLIAVLSFSASSQGQSSQPDLVKVCSISEFSDAGIGHALYLSGIPGISDNKYEFFPDAPGTLELFSDGTARLKGRVRNMTDQTVVWDIDFHYTGGSDWTTWSAGGGNYKDEASLAGSNYLDWDYFIFDAAKSNTLTGADGLTGSSLTVTHRPANYEYGLQIGTAANSKNANSGASVWFFYDGTVLGNTVSGNGDLNLNTSCSEILTICPIEQYAAGNHILWLPGVAAGNNWVPAPFGVYFAELAGGEARLYGEIQNQNDPSLVLCVDFWFSDKADFVTWSGLGRGVKGNPSNINGNEVNWDFYIFDPNRVSSLSGCSPSTLGSYITVEHSPADYNYGLQVGLGANDKNDQFGLSAWYFKEGLFQGNAVSGSGDVNSVKLCTPPPNIICFENPPIITCPADTTIDCSSETGTELLGEATADRPTTECPLNIEIFFEDDIAVNGCETVITRIWTVIDEYDNAVSCDQVITVADTTAPALLMPLESEADITCSDISLDAATGFANGTLTPEEEAAFLDAASALFVSNGLIPTGTTDDCNTSDWEEISIEVTLSDSCDALATLICTFVAEDACGNVSEPISTMLNLTDDLAPVITCPADMEVDCSADNSPASTGTATATDDCGAATVTFEDGGLSGDGCVNTFTRTWTATDACGNASSCDQVITITDTTAPDLEMPLVLEGDITCSDISLEAATGYANGTLTAAEEAAFLDAASGLFVSNGLIPEGTSDDCNGSYWDEISIEVVLSDDCSALATLICTFVAIDDCGNESAAASTSLNITDDVAPVITCPSDATVECDADNSPSATGTATATDDCGQEVAVSFTDGQITGSCTQTFTRTWTATDACGNSSSCDQVITLIDTQAPVAPTAPDNAVASCDEALPVAPELVAVDACQGEIIGVLSEEIIDGDCVNSFTVVRTWTFDDGCGNVSSVSSEVAVSDDEAPVFDLLCQFDFELLTSEGADCPSDAGFSFAQGDEFPVTEGYTIAGAQIPSLFGCVSDNCTADEDIIIRVALITEVGDDCNKTFTVDFEALDECGNVAGGFSCNYDVIDDVAPVITCPADMEVDCSADNSPASTGTATATDDCGAATVTFEDGGLSGDGCVNTFTRTWTATDACGNASSCDQVITITDTTAPDLEMPEETSMDITCMAVDYAMLLDYVDGNLSNTQMSVYESFLAGIFMQNGLTPIEAIDDCNDASFFETGIEISTDVACPAKATVRCFFIAEDACGNQSESIFTELIVIDNTTPYIFCPADIVVTCGSDISPEVTGFATATDNCVGIMEVTYEDLYVSEMCPSSFIRMWTAADECGNIATCEQLITTIEEGDCVTAPNGLEAEIVGSNSIQFSWNPVPNSVACRVFGRPSGSSSNITLGTVMGTEPSGLMFTSGQLQDGLLIEWRVICACELSPLTTSPYSPWTEFYFLTDDNKSNDADNNEGEQLNGELYPNPTRTSVFINSEFEEGDILTVMDLSGKVVGQYNVPVASGLFEINLAELESGVYFVQHSGLNGRSQTFKVVKNN
jgi:hypothetical protein